jgi:glutamate/tyrosine decarboxylase-like PLP-dependent enzyme
MTPHRTAPPVLDASAGRPTTPPAPVPDLDWSPARVRALGRDAVDLWAEVIAGLRHRPIGRDEPPEAVRTALLRNVPDEPLDTDELLSHLRELALEHSMYPGHPGFMAYISGSGTVPGAAADLLAAALNQNVGGWMLSPAATEIEQHVVRWLGTQIGYRDGGGVVTSGGAEATLAALKAARDHHGDGRVRHAGVRSVAPLVCYASSEAHVVIERAMDILGLGSDAVRTVPVDDRFRLRVDALADVIAADRAMGLEPFAVVGTAGTTATGSIDPLPEIASICEREGLWFHVDGAYGAAAALAPELRPLLTGIERADSVTIDPHKWLYVPLAAGCVLVRRPEHLPESFAVDASYVHRDRELVEHGADLGFSGVQFSRGFAALKIWVSLLAHGRAAYARRIHHDSELAHYLQREADRRPELEATAPVTLSIACFRYVPPDLDPADAGVPAYLDQLNERLMSAIQADGRSFCSNAVLGGRYCLRACIVNFRTEAVDVDRLLDVAVELGRTIDRELRLSLPHAEVARAG